ncbi:MAG TPA: S-methyl-5-thioribose-1-phosphate isomerase [Candidatus Hydrogenedentes bacterium]|nr:S-methyl-5-thioribose-1-phosphate isomerase [Candidatus Hydrogenedentota bacterium]
MPVTPIHWENGRLAILDQTRLPGETLWVYPDSAEAVREAIRALRVRGAPAIGVCAAWGVALELVRHAPVSPPAALDIVTRAVTVLRSARPTAVNLFWALDRVEQVARRAVESGEANVVEVVIREAEAIQREDEAMCEAIGRHGEPLVPDGGGVLTHCNAGALATAGIGTALAPLYVAHRMGRSFRVFADETRPLLQGARLTAWELRQAGLDVTVICDNMAASLMAARRIHMVIVGADRIAANGDTANKIGTYGLAVLARAHDIPFYVAAPSSTFDLSLEHGARIPIEERDPSEVTCWQGVPVAPEGVPAYNPAFDVTPAELITAIITEKGIISAPDRRQVAAVMGRSGA